MKDLEILLENKAGALAEMGEILGNAGVNLEGGGVFTFNNLGIAHFLVDDAEKGKIELESRGIRVLRINDVLILRLKQAVPGQLGHVCRQLADANINILAQYSDHDHQLILVVDDLAKAGKLLASMP